MELRLATQRRDIRRKSPTSAGSDLRKKNLHQAVEKPCGGALEEIFAGANRSLPANHIVAIAILRHHLVNHVERVLEIGVDKDDCVAGGIVNAGCRGQLVPEVPGKAEHFNATVARAPIDKKVDGAIGAAVVDQHNFAGIGRGVNKTRNLRGEQGQALLLVVAGNDERQESGVGPGLQIAGGHGQWVWDGAIDFDGIACGANSVILCRGREVKTRFQ